MPAYWAPCVGDWLLPWIFEARNFEQLGRPMALVAASEAASACLLVTAAMFLLGLPAAVALLLGVVAMETAPATTLMIVREYDTRGPLTDALLALLAINNLLVLVTFGIVSAALTWGSGGSAYASAHALFWSTAGSVALGVLAGLLLELWAPRVESASETMVLSIGVVLVTVGTARALGVSPLIAALTVGATIANLSEHTGSLVDELRRADPPLYAAFFVLAGAELPIDLLPQIGTAGLAYVAARSLGKTAGAWAAGRRLRMPATIQRHLGFCLLSSSSLAIGLTIQVRQQFPDLAERVTAVVLSAVILFEIIGPILARGALMRAGEATTDPLVRQESAAL
ncbi:MAG TPA: cation:proton antiporter [Vicinamibacterales bacterium]|nr:cation:proton antiporter [Vicinamibacterales bacterium]